MTDTKDTPAKADKVTAADESPVVAAVREGSAPSYRSDALTVDEVTGAPVLSPASLPQLTMPELQGLSPEDVVVPEEGDPALYGIDEDADEVPATVEAVQRGKDVAEQHLANTTREPRSGRTREPKKATHKKAD